jgi:hypothetical protein
VAGNWTPTYRLKEMLTYVGYDIEEDCRRDYYIGLEVFTAVTMIIILGII